MTTDSKLAEAAELKRLIRRVSDASYKQGIEEERCNSEIKDRRNDEKVRALLSEASAAIERLAAHSPNPASGTSEQAGEAVAWMIWTHGPVLVFMNKDEAELEFDRLNTAYPEPARMLLRLCSPQQPLSDRERERICAAIKAEDDYCVTEGDYMLDSDDCIKIVRGEWVRPDYGITKEPKT